MMSALQRFDEGFQVVAKAQTNFQVISTMPSRLVASWVKAPTERSSEFWFSHLSMSSMSASSREQGGKAGRGRETERRRGGNLRGASVGDDRIDGFPGADACDGDRSAAERGDAIRIAVATDVYRNDRVGVLVDDTAGARNTALEEVRRISAGVDANARRGGGRGRSRGGSG